MRGRTRAALAAKITALAPLLADPSDEVWDAAAWALPKILAADHLIPPLRDRWDQEAKPAIAASVLRALSFLDPAGSVGLAAEALILCSAQERPVSQELERPLIHRATRADLARVGWRRSVAR